MAFKHPLCCADDASFAVVAKNLALGRGYLLTLSYFGLDFSGSLFDPYLGTGPTSIFPVAVAIYIFGPHELVPSLVQVTVELTLLALIWQIVATKMANVNSAAVMLAFILLICATGASVPEQWHAQLGETPSALLVIAGTLYWASRGASRRAALVCGLCMGLAIMSKTLAALYVVGPAVALAVRRAPARELLRELSAYGVGVCLPILGFELWKASVLGLDGWIQHWGAFLDFVAQQSNGSNEIAKSWALTLERFAVMRERFSISWAVLLSLSPVLLIAVSTVDEKWRFALAALATGLTLHFIYWLSLSNGWPRYLYVGVVVLCFVLSAIVANQQIPVLRTITLLLVAVVLIAGLRSVSEQIESLKLARGVPSETEAAKAVSRKIESLGPDARIYTQWWAHIATLEYLADKPGRFLRPDQELKRDVPMYVVLHDRYINPNPIYEVFTGALVDCRSVLMRQPPYTLYSCQRDEL